MDNIKIGEFIQRQRKEKGMTQTELAQKLTVTNKAVSKWETGKGMPDIYLIEALADTLGVSITELIKGEKTTKEEVKAENIVKQTISLAKEEINKKDKLVKRLTISFGVGLLLVVLVNIFANIFPLYNNDLKYTQEYIVGTGNIRGEVNIAKFLEYSEDFAIGANQYGYAVFKNPEKAFKTLKREFAKGIKCIQKEFNLLPFSKLTYKMYSKMRISSYNRK